jgi:hypothetical protein
MEGTTNLGPTSPVCGGEKKQPTTLPEARVHILTLVAARAETLADADLYASLLSRYRTEAARDLIRQLFGEIAQWRRENGKRKFQSKSGTTFHDAIERFVGDLLRATAGENASGRVYRSLGKMNFKDDPVNYDVFMGVLDGLKALGYVDHEKGKTRYDKTPGWPSVTLRGRASRFWATTKLIELAEFFGVRRDTICDHFQPEPPSNPLVLRDYATGVGRNRERGPIIKDYKRTAHTKRLAADVRELNEFLAGFEIAGGAHHGYTRNFNLARWNKGGRLYSVGGGYQQMSEEKRLQMTIDGEAVAEVDIKASFLTIYHARLGVPLESNVDPYAREGVARDVAKLWVVHSFGKSRPQMRWPREAVEDYKKDTGNDLRSVAKAKDVAEKMLAAFPPLERLEKYRDIWADLQFIEAEAVVSTMLILMRSHRVPSLSMHDGIMSYI